MSTAARRWSTQALDGVLSGAGGLAPALLPVDAAGIQGAGDIVITQFAMVDARGAEVFTAAHGEEVRFRIAFRIPRRNLREHAQVFIVISRNNSERVCKFMTRDLMFDEASMREGVIEMQVSKMPLGTGHYSVAVEIAAEGHVEQRFAKFFSIDPDVYHCITHALEFTVTDSGWIGEGTIFEGEGAWSIRAMAREPIGDVRPISG
jgi:hypothetical protein